MVELVFEYQLNQPENQLNQYFPESNFGQDRLKKVIQHTFTKDYERKIVSTFPIIDFGV
jgi:hypothetical protein